jgi:hypothetical protein
MERDQVRQRLIVCTEEKVQALADLVTHTEEKQQTELNLIVCTQERNQAREELVARTEERDQTLVDLATRTQERNLALVESRQRDRENTMLKLGITFMALLGMSFYMRNEGYKTSGVARVVGSPILVYSAHSIIQSSCRRHRPIERLQGAVPGRLSSGFALALAF